MLKALVVGCCFVWSLANLLRCRPLLFSPTCMAFISVSWSISAQSDTETRLALSTQTPGRHPKENALHIKHGESLKSRVLQRYMQFACCTDASSRFNVITSIRLPITAPVLNCVTVVIGLLHSQPLANNRFHFLLFV